MDVGEDSNLFSKTPAPMVRIAWVSIVAYKYHLKKATSHFIKQSSRRITNRVPTCARLIAFKGPQGVVLKDRMRISTFWKGPRREKT